MIRCVAIDDEPRALGIIREFADQIPFLKIEASCSDSVEAWSIIKNVEPDLLFLDIEMPEGYGH
jgi:two-component system response regulator LytT